MALERVARRDRAASHCRAPVVVDRRRLDLAEDDVDHAIEELILVRHVLVERHRHHAELLREPAHAEPVKPVLVGERYGRLEHERSAQTRPAGVGLLGHPLDKCTPYTYSRSRSVRRTPDREWTIMESSGQMPAPSPGDGAPPGAGHDYPLTFSVDYPDRQPQSPQHRPSHLHDHPDRDPRRNPRGRQLRGQRRRHRRPLRRRRHRDPRASPCC